MVIEEQTVEEEDGKNAKKKTKRKWIWEKNECHKTEKIN
jgi:hypothetical protein